MRHEMASRRTVDVLTALVPVVLASIVLLPFALRSGIPGLHHDWLWPADGNGFWLRFVQNLSTWNPFGFGGDLDAPSVNYLGACWLLLSGAGLSPQWVLGIFLVVIFALGQWGVFAALATFGISLRRFERSALSFSYAFGPVCFQKFAAGHIYVVAAYELLPFFVASVWRAFRGERGWLRDAVLAGLILSVMETQIQFLGFGLIVALVCGLAASRNAARSVVSFVIIAFVPLLHVITLLMNLGGHETAGLVSLHATRQWELDMSGRFRDLLQLRGYVGYDLQTLAQALKPLYFTGRFVLVASAFAGLLVAFLTPRFRAVGVASACVGLFALLWANGWYGPLTAPFDYALHHTIAFTIVRELYHVMALYSFAVIVLAAVAASISNPACSRTIAAVSVFSTLPFVTLGANRLVPAVPSALGNTRQCAESTNLCLELPMQQPVGLTSQPQSAGTDPATLIPNSANASSPPYVYFALKRYSAGDGRELAELGVSDVKSRNDVVSRLPAIFEPNVGASFNGFVARERALHTRAARDKLPESTPPAYVEREDAYSSLDAIADARLPTGSPALFTSSFENNDVRKSWVLGTLWAWQFPDLMGVSAPEPIVSESHAPLAIHRTQGHERWLYVLLSGTTPMLDGRSPLRTSRSSNGYYWCVWPVARSTRSFALIVGGARKGVARAMFSDVSNWSNTVVTSRVERTIAVPTSWVSPWRAEGTFPSEHDATAMQFVLARAYSANWRLFVNGRDLGPPSRVHAFFNGWSVPSAVHGSRFEVERVQQPAANLWNIVATALAVVLFVWVAMPLRVKSAAREATDKAQQQSMQAM